MLTSCSFQASSKEEKTIPKDNREAIQFPGGKLCIFFGFQADIVILELPYFENNFYLFLGYSTEDNSVLFMENFIWKV